MTDAGTLEAFRNAAQKAADDPTEFKCDWAAILKGLPPQALTGQFVSRAKGIDGRMTILEGGNGPVLIGIQTVARSSGHTCTVQVTATRGSDGELTARPADAPDCVVRVVATARNRVRVTAKECQFAYCGLRASFDGVYERRTN